jgi:membrane-bound lytic murein transglycosylase B
MHELLYPRRRLAYCLVVTLGILFASGPKATAAEDLGTWIDGVRSEGVRMGISSATIAAALKDFAPIAKVIVNDRRQPEFTMTFAKYIDRVVSSSRVAKGRKKFAENRKLLAEVADRYRVQPRFIVALWGIETDFGRLTGRYPVIHAVATLAYDGRRSAYFRRELFAALRIVDDGHITLAKMKGSWAGAMGQNQFMPTSFANFAVDFDGDGRRDIWTTRADVFASSANYLKKSGWRDDQTWGRQVTLPENFDAAHGGLKVRKPIAEWQALGVRSAGGGDLPARNLTGSVIIPDGAKGPAFLVYGNFRVILKWNRSTYFATAVGRLADRIAAR